MFIPDIIEQVRTITDYPELIFSDDEIENVIEFTQDEIQAMVEAPDRFEWDEQPFIEERAVIWGTCYHLKVRSGEVSGIPMSVGDVDLSLLRQRGEVDPDLFSWGDKFYSYFYRLEAAANMKFGHVVVQRDGRSYGDE